MVNNRLSTHIVLIWNFLCWLLKVYIYIWVRHYVKMSSFSYRVLCCISDTKVYTYYNSFDVEVECLIIFLSFLTELRNEILRVYLRGTAVLWREVHVLTTKACNRVTWQNDCDQLVTNQEQSKYKIAPT